MKKNNLRDKNITYRIVGVVIVAVLILGITFYAYSMNKKSEIIENSINVIKDAVNSKTENYIKLDISDSTSSYNYQFQFYGDNTIYYIQNSKTDDVSFSFESFCDGSVEYVSTDYSAGFEILDTKNCADRSYNINYGFAGFDFSSINQSDYDVKKDGNKSIIKVKGEDLSNDIFLGEFADGEIKFNDLVITSKDNVTSLKLEFNHPLYGDMKISFSVDSSVKLEVPDYK